jgi:hypothetical protein
MEYEQGLRVEDHKELNREEYKWTRTLIKKGKEEKKNEI